MLGIALKDHLDSSGVKYSFVAEKIKMPLNIFSDMLNEKRKISADEYFAICKALGVTVDYFYDKIYSAKE